uniref:ShKT domain-containing protein n=1 Tax=Haemonchus contortus TaxID=6289 RepID=A0A7I5EBG0_HAECO|nr:Metridin ShK toxin domain containing protein [Haemonchus contortus]
MFFYFLCALLLLNAFSTEAQECSDKAVNTRAGGKFCDFMTSKDPKGQVLCTADGYEELAKEYCAKTCGFC